MTFKLKWVRILFDFIIYPIITALLWYWGYESVVIGIIMLYLMIILGYLNPEEFRKQ